MDPRNLNISLSAIEDYVPFLVRSNNQKWRNPATGAILDLTDVLTAFSDYFPPDFQGDHADIPDWLREIKNSVEISLYPSEQPPCKLSGGIQQAWVV